MGDLKTNGELRQRNGAANKLTEQQYDDDKLHKLSHKNSSAHSKTIGLIFVSLLLDLLAFTMILPLLPSLLDYYDKQEGHGTSLYASLLGAVQSFQKLTGAPEKFSSVLFGGALGSMYSFLQFLTSPIVGALSDAYGRKPMLLICLIGIALSHALWGVASSFSVFVLARFIGGLSKANVSLSMAVVADSSNEKTRARGMGDLKTNGELRQRNGAANKLTEQQYDDDKLHKLSHKNSSAHSKTIGLIFVSLLLDLLAFTMILPLLPSLLDYYDKQEGHGTSLYASLLGAVQSFQKLTGAPEKFSSVLFGGALGSMYSFLQFLTSPIVGALSDAYGRKPMLLICLIGIALSHALWGVASSFSVFVLARFIGGLSKANVSLSMAVVADSSNEKTRARGMALVGLAFSIGFIVGPCAGAWFAITNDDSFGLWGQRPAFYALGLSLANIALVAFCVPESLPKDKRAPLAFTLTKTIDYISPWHLLRFTAVKNLSEHQNKVLSKLGLIYFLYLFIYSGLEFTITFLTHHTFNYTAMQQGKMFLVIGLIMAVLQGGAARRLGARGAERAARGALWLTPLAFVCVALAAAPRAPLAAPLVWLWLGLILFALSTAFAVSCMTAMAASQAPPAGRGAVLGALRSLGALARAAGPLLAAAAYWCFGAAVTYTIGSIILIVPAVMLFRLKA